MHKNRTLWSECVKKAWWKNVMFLCLHEVDYAKCWWLFFTFADNFPSLCSLGLFIVIRRILLVSKTYLKHFPLIPWRFSLKILSRTSKILGVYKNKVWNICTSDLQFWYIVVSFEFLLKISILSLLTNLPRF